MVVVDTAGAYRGLLLAPFLNRVCPSTPFSLGISAIVGCSSSQRNPLNAFGPIPPPKHLPVSQESCEWPPHALSASKESKKCVQSCLARSVLPSGTTHPDLGSLFPAYGLVSLAFAAAGGNHTKWATKHGQTQTLVCPYWQSILLAPLRALHTQVIIT